MNRSHVGFAFPTVAARILSPSSFETSTQRKNTVGGITPHSHFDWIPYQYLDPRRSQIRDR